MVTTATRTLVPPEDDDPDGPDPERHEIHLVVYVASAPAALDLAERIAEALVFLPELSAGETTVIDETDRRWEVYCDRRLNRNNRCQRRANHPEPCI